MYWECNFRSTCPKEIGAVRKIIVTERNIRFENIHKQTQFTSDKTTVQEAIFWGSVVLSSLMLVVTASAA